MVEATLESTFSHETAGTAATDDNDNNSNENDNTKEEVMKKHSRVALFQDAITVSIPIDVTVDLGVAFRRTRDKRIAGLYNAFPSLKPKDETEGEEDEDEEEDDDEEGGEEGAADSSDGAAKKKKKNDNKKKAPSKASDNVPQPREFASVLDYLEAKYVRGVMIHNEQPAAKKKKGDSDDSKSKQEEDEEDDDEGQGSVYSETSFLDDRDLQRDVAEQVLAQTTTTKLELEGDDDFFVNVGDLDVEENELTQHTYDPLEDSPTKKSKTKTNTKKSKKPATTSTKTGSPAKKKKIPSKATADKDDKSKGEKKKKAKPAPKATTKGKVKTVDNSSDSSEAVVAAVAASNTKKPVPKKNKEEIKKLKQKAKKYKNIMEKRFEKVKKMIKTLDAESLPRSRPSTSKVTITCPANKKEGDEVTFT